MTMTGKTLRSVRRKLNWTQSRMAQAVGVATNTIARWEREEIGISEPVSRLISSIEANAPKTKTEVKR
jgi:transcriptional regulator with XRE-family HTH domain